MMKWTAILVVLAFLTGMAMPAQSHTGLGGWTTAIDDGILVEAEIYSYIERGCDPAPDGGHALVGGRDATDIVTDVFSSVLPYAKCMVGIWDYKTDTPIEFKEVRLRADHPSVAKGTPLTFEFQVLQNTPNTLAPSVVAAGPVTILPGEGYKTFDLTPMEIIGSQSWLRGLFWQFVPTGDTPAGTDVWVDYFGTKQYCKNAAPVLDTILADGMVDSFVGWAGDTYDYTFDFVGVADPEEDPFDIIVTWSDGLVQSITSAEYAEGLTTLSRDFDLSEPTKFVTETLEFVIEIIDDPIHCVEETVAAKYITLSRTFMVVPDLVGTLLSPFETISCHDGQFARTWTDTGLDAIFGSCPTTQTVSQAGFPPASILGELRVSGETHKSALGEDLAFTYSALPYAEGLQNLQACYSVPTDKFGRDFCSEPFYFENNHCTNALPTLTGVTGDGMIDGLTGWLGLPYTFTADYVDSDGDPVTVEWIWDDQTSGFGTTVEKTFYEAGGHPFQVRLIEDPSARCPGAPTEEVVVQGNMFMGAGDLLPDIVRPKADMSCIGGRYVPTLFASGQDVMASRCTIEGKVDDLAPGLETVIQGSFVLDGEEIHQQRASVISTLYDSARYPTQELTLQACFEADDDKYERVFCSDGFRYLNIGS